MLLRYKRLVFSNEMKTACLNGNTIKKISSGGDTIIGRTHNAVEQEFSSHFLAICMANDLPKIKPYDDAVAGRSNVISFNKEYVDEPLHEYHLKKDANVEDEIETLRFQRVFVGLLIREHLWFMEGGKKVIIPDATIVAKQSWICQDMNYIDAFKNDFEFTNVETDFVKSSDIEWWINVQDLGITMKKFGGELTKYATIHKMNNVYVKDKKVSGKNVKCWFGIKKIESIETDIIY
jgi:phage/plasmid-associated DNA primase